ncbi:MAG: T9SS type A sorting domain-containing protein, partial [Bacteroidota bacterium]
QLNESNQNALNFQVFPNHIETKENHGVLRIINVSGQVVYEEYISTQKDISTAGLSSGKYIVQMNQQTTSWFKP